MSTNKRTAELWDLVQKRQRILGLAWLTDVGHKCPGTRKGIPLSDALKYGMEIDAKISELMKSHMICTFGSLPKNRLADCLNTTDHAHRITLIRVIHAIRDSFHFFFTS